MNPSDIQIFELTPSSVCTEDNRARRRSDASLGSHLALCNFRVVKTPTSRRRSSATMDSTTVSMSWHDSMEDFTDGEDFLTGSPIHANPFREEVNSAGSLRRTRDIPLNNPIMAKHISLPLALEPRSDSPECSDSELHSSFMDGSVKSECGGGVTDANHCKSTRTEEDQSKKRRRHKKRRSSHHKEPSSLSKHKENSNDKSSRSRKKEESHRPSRRGHPKEVPARSEKSSKSRSAHGRNLNPDVEKHIEKHVSEKILSLSLDDIQPKKKESPSKRALHEKKSRRHRNQDLASSNETARQRIQEAHVLAMKMLQK